MENIRSVHLKRLHGQLGEVVYQLTRVQFSSLSSPEMWQPAVNAYSCADCVAICVDLAGVDKKRIELRVKPRRLLVRGYRPPPEPEETNKKPMQVLVMEIDYGPFEREILLPSDVDPDGVTAEQRNGLLWIYLPLRPHA